MENAEKAAQIAKDEAREAIHSSKKESDENHKNRCTLRLAAHEKDAAFQVAIGKAHAASAEKMQK